MSRPGLCWVAGLVVADDGEHVLLVERDEQQWDLPGGPLYRGEPIAPAVRRVVSAQATLGVRIGHLIGVHDVRHSVPNAGPMAVKTTLVFTAQHVLGRPTPAGPTRRCLWVPLPQAPLMMGPARAVQLAGASAGAATLSATAVRTPAKAGMPRTAEAFG